MNIFKLPALWLLTAAVAFAQPAAPKAAPPAVNPVAAPVAAPAAIPPAFLDSVITMEPTPSSSSEFAVYLPPPVSSSSAETLPVPEGKTIFDFVRGTAYNPYGTTGAASTVTDLVTTPSDIHGQKFLFVSPSDALGYTAFSLGSSTALVGLDNQDRGGSLPALVLGFATSGFGLALNYSVSKSWIETQTTDASITDAGDNIGLSFSIPIGSSTLYANAGWLTYAPSGTTETTAANGISTETTNDYSEIQGAVGLTGSSGSLNYDAYLKAVRTGGTTNDTTVDPYTHLGVALHLNIGYVALQNSNSRIIVGANNHFSAAFLDKIKRPSYKSDNIMGFVIGPNILGEVALTENWLAFAGATHDIDLVAGDGDRNSKSSTIAIRQTNGTNAHIGVRYQKPTWALESLISGTNVIFTQFGGFLYF